MAWNRIQAERLLTDREMTAFKASLSDAAPQMSDKDLQGQIRRVRALRDKYQDLLRRQRVSTRERTGSKSGRGGMANDRTGQKVEVFSQALERLEQQQARRERGAARKAGRPAAGQAEPRNTVRSAVKAALEAKAGPGRTSRAGASGRPQAARSEKAPSRAPSGDSGASAAGQAGPAVPHAKRMQAMGQQRPLAHVSSRGRRQQGRRDAR